MWHGRPRAVDVEARIAEFVEAHRDELVALVDAELDRALDRLVVERLAERNGARVTELESDAEGTVRAPEATPLCASCGERPTVAGRRRERRALASAAESPGGQLFG